MSAVVSLYTVVITDLIYKLKYLYDREEDTGAEKILKEVDTERKRDITKSHWGKLLVVRIAEQTKLLKPHDKFHIETLKNHRNLYAHLGNY